MFKTTSQCDVCGKELVGHDCLPVVETGCTCCQAQFRACPSCRKGGCPVCGGKVRELWKVRTAPIENALLLGILPEARRRKR